MTDLAAIIRASIENQERSGALPPGAGLAVAVVQQGKPAVEFVHGFRERDHNLPVGIDTQFEMCSLTKAVTAMAAMVSAQERGLSLDAPINASGTVLTLADAERTAAISLRDILAQRVALPAHDLFWYLAPRSTSELRQAVAAMPALEGGFRKSFVYGNVLYGLLGHAFPELFGATWAAKIQSLTASLGMTATSDEVRDVDVALPYVGTRRVPAIDSSVVVAAGGLRSSVRDMRRWLNFWTSGGRAEDGTVVVDASLVDDALRSHMPAGEVSPVLLNGLEWLSPASARSELGYGLGWFIATLEGERVAFHPGFIDGFSQVAVILPDRKVGLVVLCNVNFSAGPGHIAKAIVDALRGQATEEPSAPNELALGRYRNELFGEASVIAEGGHVYFEHRGHRWPWTRSGEHAAQIVVTAFGMAIPLDVAIDTDADHVRALRVPLAMDPRVAPSVFVREAT